MSVFFQSHPYGTRFSDGTYGVFFAANDLETAIAEAKYRREQFMRATAQNRMDLDGQVYQVDLEADLHDLRNEQLVDQTFFDKFDYSTSQHVAKTLRSKGSNGIVYRSIYGTGGECVTAFRPPALSNARPERTISFVWDELQITETYEKRHLQLD